MNYRNHVLKTARVLSLAGYPGTCVHSGDLSLTDSTVEITGTDLHVQVCLHGDYAVGKVLPEGRIRFWDCDNRVEVIKTLRRLNHD